MLLFRLLFLFVQSDVLRRTSADCIILLHVYLHLEQVTGDVRRNFPLRYEHWYLEMSTYKRVSQSGRWCLKKVGQSSFISSDAACLQPVLPFLLFSCHSLSSMHHIAGRWNPHSHLLWLQQLKLISLYINRTNSIVPLCSIYSLTSGMLFVLLAFCLLPSSPCLYFPKPLWNHNERSGHLSSLLLNFDPHEKRVWGGKKLTCEADPRPAFLELSFLEKQKQNREHFSKINK